MKRLMMIPVIVAAISLPALAGEDMDGLAEKAKISPAQAATIAKGKHPGKVKEIELKGWEGRPVYKVEFSDDGKVYVDAIDGKVVERRNRRDNK